MLEVQTGAHVGWGSPDTDETRGGRGYVGTRRAHTPGQRRVAALRTLAGLLPELLVAAAGVTVLGWRMDVPGPWRDELVTLDLAARPVPDLFAVTRLQDLVHLAYYLLVHPIATLAPGLHPLRVLSLVAVTLTAVVLVRIGKALSGAPVGVAAGLLLLASPAASRYAQEARSFALVGLLAALSLLALIRACERTLAGRRALAWWAWYCLLLLLIGVGNLLGLLCVLGHAAYLVTAPPRGRGLLVAQWLASLAGVGIVLLPFVHAAAGQSGQVSWLQRPGAAQADGILLLVWPSLVATAAAVLVTGAAVVATRASAAARVFAVGLAWGLLSPVTLWAVSQLTPLYHEHYLFPQAGGLPLAVAALAGVPMPRGRLRLVAVPLTGVLVLAPVAALAAVGLPLQREYRLPDGHGEDVPGVLQVFREQARPGDAAVFLPYWLDVVTVAGPLPAGVDEVVMERTARQARTIIGTPAEPSVVRARLAGRCRVWVVTQPGAFAGSGPADEAAVAVLGAGYDRVATEHRTGFEVQLLQSREPACAD